MLETSEQRQHREQARERRKREARERGRTQLAWRRRIVEGNLNERNAALAELASMSDEMAEPIIVGVLLKPTQDELQTAQLQLEAMRMFSKFDDPRTSQVLARYALMSTSAGVRDAARNGLKRQPLQYYVPFLLTQLTMPLEVGISTRVYGNQVANDFSFYRAGGPAGKDYQRRQTTFQRIQGPQYLSTPTATVGRRFVPEQLYRTACNSLRRKPAHYETSITGVFHHYSPNPQFAARRQASIRGAERQANAVAAAADVKRRNQITERQNERVAEVLRQTTNRQLESHPVAWWDWWRQHLDEHPGLRQFARQNGMRRAEMLSEVPPGSFALGTDVWTSTGREAIEHVEIGDLVLTQHPITGELAYKPVLEVLRAVQPTRRLDLAEDAFRCAPGQLFWRTGEGWWFAQDLDIKFAVHGLFGSMPVTGNAEQIPGETRHLIVADLSNYFVGQQGLLVHDATQPQDLRVCLPGRSEVADRVGRL